MNTPVGGGGQQPPEGVVGGEGKVLLSIPQFLQHNQVYNSGAEFCKVEQWYSRMHVIRIFVKKTQERGSGGYAGYPPEGIDCVNIHCKIFGGFKIFTNINLIY